MFAAKAQAKIATTKLTGYCLQRSVRFDNLAAGAGRRSVVVRTVTRTGFARAIGCLPTALAAIRRPQ